MANSADRDQLASSELIWIYIVCKGRVYRGSAEQGLNMAPDKTRSENYFSYFFTKAYVVGTH